MKSAQGAVKRGKNYSAFALDDSIKSKTLSKAQHSRDNPAKGDAEHAKRSV